MSQASCHGPYAMSRVTAQISMSLDGYVAGPDQRPGEPLGTGGERLHEWVFGLEAWRAQHGLEGGERNADSDVVAHMFDHVGAHVMGRKMFGGFEGPWDPEWKGWWGDDPPYHTPTFVVTHHARDPLPMEGGTTFRFVTEGVEAAVERAREAAGPDREVRIDGGASTINQALAAGLVDELVLHIVPLILGAGARLLVGVGDLALEPVEVAGSPAVTHVRYRVGGRA